MTRKADVLAAIIKVIRSISIRQYGEETVTYSELGFVLSDIADQLEMVHQDLTHDEQG